MLVNKSLSLFLGLCMVASALVPIPALGTLLAVEIAPLPGHDVTQASGVNNLGQVVGTSFLRSGGVSAPPTRGFLWENGSLTNLGDLPGGDNFSFGFAINNLGQAVGSSGQSGPENAPFNTHAFERAFLWENGNITNLGFPPGFVSSNTRAVAINDVGQIVGNVPFLWENGILTGLRNLPTQGIVVSATDINNSGVISGFGKPNPGVGSPEAVRAVIINNGQATFVNNLPDETDSGIGIRFRALNNNGQFVGVRSRNGTITPFIWEGGIITDLISNISSGGCDPIDINDFSQVIGNCSGPNLPSAFLWDDQNGFQDLNRLVQLPVGGLITVASGINDKGQIAAQGTNGLFERAFLLMPTGGADAVPEPSTLALFAIGLVGLGFMTQRR